MLRRSPDAPASAAIYAIFVGFGHSGHSLIGAMLDAHPNAVIANELNILRQLYHHDLNLHDIFKLTLTCGRENNSEGSWTNTGYSYRIDQARQGDFENLRVIGDKKGGGTSRMIAEQPAVWDRFRKLMADRLRVICCVRHPLDLIAAAAYRRGQEASRSTVDRVLTNAQAASRARQDVGTSRFMLIRHEDFVADPKGHLSRLCAALDLPADDAYLRSCVSLVNTTPNQRRFELRWSNDVIEYLEDKLSAPDAGGLFNSYLPLRLGSALT